MCLHVHLLYVLIILLTSPLLVGVLRVRTMRGAHKRMVGGTVCTVAPWASIKRIHFLMCHVWLHSISINAYICSMEEAAGGKMCALHHTVHVHSS